MNETKTRVKTSPSILSEVLATAWKVDPLPNQGDEATERLRKILQTNHPLLVEGILDWLEKHDQIKREGNELWIVAESETPKEVSEPEVLRVPPWSYLRAMFAIAWNAFRHPWSTTTIDLATGRVIHRE